MALSHVILTVLKEERVSGYDIVKRFNSVLGYFWQASHQQIYQELSKLSKAGLVQHETVVQDDKPDKKIYTLTDAGEAALAEWLGSPTKARSTNDEILVKLYAGKFLARDSLLEILYGAKRQYERNLEKYQSIESTYFSDQKERSEVDELVYMALRKGILAEQANVDWVEESLRSKWLNA